MAAKKKTETEKMPVANQLDGLISTIAEATAEFNKIHVEYVISEAPSSACYARLRVELKHLVDIKNIIVARLEKDDQQENSQ
jgi:hypothetical protein